MPTISFFYGIRITMYWEDHARPHFHAWYSGDKAKFDISSGQMTHGYLPPSAHKMIRQWAKLHKNELLEDWDRAEDQRKLKKIDPWE